MKQTTKLLSATLIALAILLSYASLVTFSQVGGQNSATLSNPYGANLSAAGANCSASLVCAWQKLPPNPTVTSVVVSGTFVATLQFEQSADGVNFVAASPASTATTGTTTFTTTGFIDFRVRVSAYTSGIASVNITTAASGTGVIASSGGGTPGGATTNVQYNLAGAFAGDSGLTYVGGANPALAVGAGSGSPTFTINGNGAPSTAGNVRLSSNITIGWRNVGNTANLILAHDQTTDFLTYGGTPASAGFQTGAYATLTNCSVNSVSPAACASAAAGSFVVPTTTTAYTVNTTRVTAASRIFLFPHTDTRDLPGAPTCVVPAITAEPVVSAIVAATSFSIAIASTTGQTCWDYWIVN